MITRPLELASRLRPEPRSFDWAFFVNALLIVLFFSLFGSRFVLAPGFSALPAIAGSNANARPATHHITVHSERQILAGDGLRDVAGLKVWLEAQAKTARQSPVLLVVSKEDVDLGLITRITSVAVAAGFDVQIASVEPKQMGAGGR